MDSQRGLVQRIERKLEATVGDALARLFGGTIVPEELEAALHREAADGVRSLEGDRLLAPNEYVITLSVHDYENVGADEDLTADAFARHLAVYIGEQGWETYGDVVVRFQQSSNLHTGQVRAHAAVNPDVSPRPTVNDSAPSQSDHAFTAEPGVSPMTDNPSYRGGQGEAQPGDEYYDERYGRPQDDARAGPEPRGPYPPEQGGYPDQGPGGYPPPRRPEQGGYPQQGGYPDQGPGGYPPPYEERPPVGHGGPPGYRQPPGGYGPPVGGQPGYGDYGRPPARPGYGHPEQRPPYPEQGGYDQGAPPYGRPDYGQPDYGRYGEAPPAGGGYGEAPAGYDYGQPPAAGGGYAAPPGYGEASAGYGEASAGYDYGQPAAAGGYDSYGQGGYPEPTTTVTLQLDDGSGRSYQLREGINVVGRGQDAQFRLPDTGVSRRHLEIRWDGQVALLSDLNSTNGTTVNNAPVQEWQLADGDVIRLGHSEIIVRVT